MSSKEILSLTIVLLACLVLAGCNDDPLQKVQVYGTVTFDGGACPGPGRLVFLPVEAAAGLPFRPASGKFKADGKYRATSFRAGDGLVPGKYLVSITCFDVAKVGPSTSDQVFNDASLVAESFEPKELIVSGDSSSIEFNLDVPKR